MAKSRTQKSELLDKYKELLNSSNGYILIDTNSLDTLTITKFKMDLEEVNAKYEVIKNSVFKIALQEAGQPVETQVFDGPTAVITYSDDPTAPAKLIKKLREELDKGEIKGKFAPKLGNIEGAYVDSEKVMQLADIPSREVLLAQLLGSMSAPITGVMHAMTDKVRGFTMVLKQLSEK